jgi:hypothetical protein
LAAPDPLSLEDLVDVRIGLVYTPAPLEVELADDADVEALKAEVAGALADEGTVLWLTDKRGNQIAVNGAKVTYITIGSGADKGRIGFGS